MISVVITTFEQTASLIGLLYCLLVQDISEPFEIIVCDDGSSAATIRALSENIDLSLLDIRYVWQPKNGYRAAQSKNNGIRIAMGDLLVFLDADILVGPDYLRRHRVAHVGSRMIVCNPRRWVVDYHDTFLLNSGIYFIHQQPKNVSVSDSISELRRRVGLLIERLAIDCVDVDRISQREAYESNAPWMSCVGFSFSVDKSEEVYFDETFEGWGPEDRELALRLAIEHNHTVHYHDDIEVFHMEDYSTGRNSMSLLPEQHATIVAYLRNMLYLDSKYPQHDLSAIMAPLTLYDYDAQKRKWVLRRDSGIPRISSPGEYKAHLTLIWLLLHNH